MRVLVHSGGLSCGPTDRVGFVVPRRKVRRPGSDAELGVAKIVGISEKSH